MEENQPASEIFTCSLCAKTCGSRKSQIRHISYCRRTKSRVRSRKRACLTCTKAKTHCDLIYPSCSRCTGKNINCVYGLSPQSPKAIEGSQETTPETSLHQTPDAVPITTSSIDFDSQLAVYGNTNPIEILGNNSTDFVSSIISGQGTWDFETNTISASPYRWPPPGLPFQDNAFNDFSNFNHVGFSLLDELVPRPQKAFWPRKKGDSRFSLNRHFVLCTLRSYPHQILPGKSLPPFIHPQSLINSTQEDGVIQKSLPVSLAACAAIIQMCSVKDESNALFIWRAIRMEQERLSAECLKFDQAEAVAALQAVTAYFLLRLSEDNDNATTFDVPLIYTMIKITEQVSRLVLMNKNFSICNSWEDWVLAESTRRTIVVLCLVDALFDISSVLTQYKCDGSVLAGMALPCGRDLWRATNSSEWKRNYAARIDEKQLTYGDLLFARFRTDAMIDAWLSQLDDFGTLVMAAASLTQ
ncbi:hypothetical protein BGZ60DRAFT_398670 [Tricladium varicosporioides]|nr:hypothetical protein BGZ60DRAFT_398670 [Hymenoscyphus varicosporioides]